MVMRGYAARQRRRAAQVIKRNEQQLERSMRPKGKERGGELVELDADKLLQEAEEAAK